MITRLVYQDSDTIVELSDTEWFISLQSTFLGEHQCYVASSKKLPKALTISEKVVLLIEEKTSSPAV